MRREHLWNAYLLQAKLRTHFAALSLHFSSTSSQPLRLALLCSLQDCVMDDANVNADSEATGGLFAVLHGLFLLGIIMMICWRSPPCYLKACWSAALLAWLQCWQPACSG